MSFNKARVTRFNEASSCAPPPTKYDPKLGSSVRDIKFDGYSGRAGPLPSPAVDGDAAIFRTPAKQIRGRPKASGSASVRSASDNRLQKVSRSNSTKSLHSLTGRNAPEFKLDANFVGNGSSRSSSVDNLSFLEPSKEPQLKYLEDQVSHLQSALDDEALTRRNLEADIQLLNNNIVESNLAHLEIQSQLEQAEQMKQKLQTEVQELAANVEQHKRNLEDVNFEKCKLNQQLLENQVELTAVLEKFDYLQRQHDVVNTEVLQLKTSMEVDAANITTLSDEVELYKANMNEQQEINLQKEQAFQAELQHLRTSLENIAQIKQTLEENIQLLNKEIEQKALAYQEIQSRLEQEEQMKQKLEIQVQELAANVERNFEDANLERCKLNQQLLENQSELATFQEKFDYLQQQYDAVVVEVQQMKTSMEMDANIIATLTDEVELHKTRIAEQQEILLQKEQGFQHQIQHLQTCLENEGRMKQQLEEYIQLLNKDIEQGNLAYFDLQAKLQQEEQMKHKLEKDVQELVSNVEQQKRNLEDANLEKCQLNQQLLEGQSELTSVRENFNDLQHQHDNVNNVVLQLKTSLESSADTIITLSNEVELHKTRIAEQQEILLQKEQAFQTELQHLQTSLENEAQIKQKLEEDLQLSNEEIEQKALAYLEIQSRLEQEEQIKQKLEDKVQELAANVEQQKRTIEDADLERCKLNQELLDSQSELASIRENYKDLQQQHDVVNNEVVQLKTSLETDADTIITLTAEVELQKSRIAEQQKIHLEKEQTLQHQLRDVQTCLENETQIKQQFEQDIQLLNKDIEQKDVAYLELQSKLEEAEQLQQKLQTEVQELTTNVEQQKCNLEEVHLEKCQLNQQLLESQSELTTVRENFNDLQQQHDNMHNEVLQLKTTLEMDEDTIITLAEEVALQKNLKAEQQKIHLEKEQSFQNQLQHLQTSFENEVQLKQKLEEDMQRLNTDIEQKDHAYLEIQSKLEQEVQLKQELQAEVQELTSNLEQQTRKLEDSNLERSKLNEQLLDNQTELTAVREKFDYLQQQYDIVNIEVLEMKTTLETGAETIVALSEEVVLQKNRIAEQQIIHLEKEQTFQDQLHHFQACLQNETQIKQKLEADMKLVNEDIEHRNLMSQGIQLRLEEEERMKQKLQSEVQELARNLQEEKRSHGDTASEKRKLSRQLLETEKELTFLGGKYTELEQQYTMAGSELTLAKASSESDAETIKTLSEQVELYQNKIVEIQSLHSSTDLLEARIRDLTIENKSMKDDIDFYQSMYGDSANRAGHQNNKQRIHHVIKIKDENIKLRDENTALRQKVAALNERLHHATTPVTQRRFDPSQAFKPVLREPYIRDERDVRGPDARGTFTVSKKTSTAPPRGFTIVDSAKKESREGVAFNVTFTENKEN